MRGIQQLAVCRVDQFGNSDLETILQPYGDFSHRRSVPAVDEQRSHGDDIRIQPGGDTALDTAQVCLRGRDILRTGE